MRDNHPIRRRWRVRLGRDRRRGIRRAGGISWAPGAIGLLVAALFVLAACAGSPVSPGPRQRAYNAYARCAQAGATPYIAKAGWTANAIANQAESSCYAQYRAYRQATRAFYLPQTLDPSRAIELARSDAMQMDIRVHAAIVARVRRARGK